MPLKVCPKCSEKLHVRCSSCKCGHSFFEKKTVIVPVGIKTGGPKKACPACKASVHVKRSICTCGHVFYKTENGPAPVPMTKEQKASILEAVKSINESGPAKECPECHIKVHSRRSVCDCGHVFYERKVLPDYNWHELKRGDIIKSVQGYGPYWLNSKSKEKTYMGCYGVYIVKKVDERSNGLWVTEYKGKLNGRSYEEFMYMGDDKPSKLLNTITNSRHKIMVFKPKVKVNG